MVNWRRWVFPGLLATVVLTALAMVFHSTTIENDLSAKASTLLAGKHEWAQVALDGRDLTLTGTAATAEAQQEAADLVASTYDVRIVRNQTELLDLVKPYIVGVSKNENGITLTGHAPNESARSALVAAAETAMPGFAISNELELGRGAPAELAAMTTFGLSQLANMTMGEISLSDMNYSVSGTAIDSQAFENEINRANAALPGGAILANLDIKAPPAAGTYSWSATKSADGAIVLDGIVPSIEARDRVIARAADANAGATITDQMQIASGEPDGFVDIANFALGFLPNLKDGSATIEGTQLTVRGNALDAANFQQAQAAWQGEAPEATQLGAFEITQPEAVETNTGSQASNGGFRIETNDQTVILTGDVPTAEVEADILASVRRIFGDANDIDNRLTVTGEGPDNLTSVATVGINALARLQNGVANITDTELSVSGSAYSSAAQADIQRQLTNSLPQGFTGKADIGLRPAPLEAGGGGPLDPQICQDRLNALLVGRQIRFETAEAIIESDSFGLLDRLAYTARACPSSTIQIAGHTDSDGDEAYNQQLSERRAISVVNYLIAAGVSSSRLSAQGLGESQPIASNETDEGKARNRRIEFNVIQ